MIGFPLTLGCAKYGTAASQNVTQLILWPVQRNVAVTGSGALRNPGGYRERAPRQEVVSGRPDGKAFSADNGKELWSTALPASAHALPITYEAGGRQFVVIAAGGSAKVDEEGQSDALVAFALP